MRSAEHLFRSRHGIYYARFLVPAELRKALPGLPKELKTSLSSSNRRLAARQARALSLAWMKFQSLLETSMEDFRLHGYTLTSHPLTGQSLTVSAADSPSAIRRVLDELIRDGARIPATMRRLVESPTEPMTLVVAPDKAEVRLEAPPPAEHADARLAPPVSSRPEHTSSAAAYFTPS